MSTLRWSVVLTAVLATATPVLAQPPASTPPGAGRIKVVSGAAFIVRDGAAIAARAGQIVFEADGLKTGADGRIGMTLTDDTRLSLGPNSELRLKRFVYSPGTGGLEMVVRFVRGVGAYVSGRMAKLAPDSIRLETPAAIVGVRGTSLAIRVEP